MTQRPKLRRFAFIRYPSQAHNAGAYPLDPFRPIADLHRLVVNLCAAVPDAKGTGQDYLAQLRLLRRFSRLIAMPECRMVKSACPRLLAGYAGVAARAGSPAAPSRRSPSSPRDFA